MELKTDEQIKKLNTFGVDAKARNFAEIRSIEDLKQARTELEANRGQIDGYRTLVATMDSQITALQAQMDLLAGGSKEWQTLNTQMQELITQRDAMQTGIAEFDQNEALLLQNEVAYEEGKKALDAKWAELATLKKTYDSGMADYLSLIHISEPTRH